MPIHLKSALKSGFENPVTRNATNTQQAAAGTKQVGFSALLKTVTTIDYTALVRGRRLARDTVQIRALSAPRDRAFQPEPTQKRRVRSISPDIRKARPSERSDHDIWEDWSLRHLLLETRQRFPHLPFAQALIMVKKLKPTEIKHFYNHWRFGGPKLNHDTLTLAAFHGEPLVVEAAFRADGHGYKKEDLAHFLGWAKDVWKSRLQEGLSYYKANPAALTHMLEQHKRLLKSRDLPPELQAAAHLARSEKIISPETPSRQWPEKTKPIKKPKFYDEGQGFGKLKYGAFLYADPKASSMKRLNDAFQAKVVQQPLRFLANLTHSIVRTPSLQKRALYFFQGLPERLIYMGPDKQSVINILGQNRYLLKPELQEFTDRYYIPPPPPIHSVLPPLHYSPPLLPRKTSRL